MRKTHYLPMGDQPRRAWLNKFNTELQSVGPLVGVTPAEIASVNNDTLTVNYILDQIDIFKIETQERIRYKDLLFDAEPSVPINNWPDLPVLAPAPAAVLAGVFKRVPKLVQRIKTHEAYNEAMGRTLGIIGAEKVIDMDHVKPQITVRKIAGSGITLDFVKGSMDGVVIWLGCIPPQKSVPASTEAESDAATEGAIIWTELTRVNHSPYTDGSNNMKINAPETRYYKMQYYKKDEVVGIESDIMRVVAEVYQGKAGSELAKIVK